MPYSLIRVALEEENPKPKIEKKKKHINKPRVVGDDNHGGNGDYNYNN